jgi:anti-anti-sigma factor
MSSAGHLPPVLATPAGTELVEIVPGPPLGVVSEARYTSTTTTLPAHSTLLLYTDGLVERRGEAVDVGLGRLRSATENLPPEDVCRDVMLQLVGSTPTLDDVALLAIGRTEAPDRPATACVELRLAPAPDSVARARDFALEAGRGMPPATRGVLKLLVSELATNCVIHAASEFTLRLVRETDRVRVECSDTAAGTVRRRDAELNDSHGRGVSFVQQLADDWGVEAHTADPGKTVWFVLRLDRPDATGAGAPGDTGTLVLDLSGELDIARTHEIVARGAALLEDAGPGHRLVVDLSRVGFIDSSGLSALLRLRRTAVARDVAMSLRGVPPVVAAVLRLSGLDQVLLPD